MNGDDCAEKRMKEFNMLRVANSAYTSPAEPGVLKYSSQERNYLFYECSPLLGFITSKKQERLRSELLSEGKITNLLVFLT